MDKPEEKKYIVDVPSLMAEWDWDKNDSLGFSPHKTTLHCSRKRWWKCEKGHSWDMSPDKRIKSNGCPYCLNKRVLIGYNDLSTLFPQLAEEWDFDENQIDINSVVIGGIQKIHWKCSKCQHKWIAAVRMRTLRGTGCPKCGKAAGARKRIETLVANHGRITTPLLLKEWDYEKNKQLELFPDKLTEHSNKKAWWICSTCGYRWEAKITNRSNGRGCPLCANQVVVTGINDLCTTHPHLASEWDYDVNGDLLPQNVSYGMGKKVGWKCPLGHKYLATILHRSSGTNCPICFSGRQTSFAEQVVFYYVKKLYPNAINRYKDIFDNSMELDIYIPDIGYGIEYDGSFWHKQNKYEREKKKYEICKLNGIKLIRIKAFENESFTEAPSAADYTVFLKEDSIPELQKLIQILYSKLCKGNILFDKKLAKAMATVNIERDKYKISSYLYEQKDSFADEYPELATEWHPTKNGDLTPYMFKSGSSFSVWWQCSTCKNEWETSIYHRVNGTGCKKCSIAKHSGANHYLAKRIYQYTKEGVFIKEWETISEAAKTENINRANIQLCAKEQRAVAGGYRWSFEYLEKLPPIQRKHKNRKGINGKPIIQLDLMGNVVNHFISLNEAEEKTGINATMISKAINGHVSKAGGFLWEVDKSNIK